jgi:DNA (cytosine-5)-methyltransferase 1
MQVLGKRARRSVYLSELSNLEIPDSLESGKIIDLFAGCGGLSLGFESVGFETIGYEKEEKYVETYNNNLKGKCLHQELGVETTFPNADVVIGGPPCQPWSETGKNLGRKDSRDGFPAFIHCVKQVQPKLFIAENVKGLTFEKNKKYLSYIIRQFEDLGYEVESKVIRMVNHSLPQKRERLFIIGHHGGFNFPKEKDIIFTVEDALGPWARQEPSECKYLTPSEDRYIASYEKKCQLRNSRDLHLDKPSRTLTCRNLSGSTSDMIRLSLASGRRRKIRVKEAARIQGFPDWFEFTGSESSCFNQIGQSVPPLFSRQLALSVLEYLKSKNIPLITSE